MKPQTPNPIPCTLYPDVCDLTRIVARCGRDIGLVVAKLPEGGPARACGQIEIGKKWGLGFMVQVSGSRIWGIGLGCPREGGFSVECLVFMI